MYSTRTKIATLDALKRADAANPADAAERRRRAIPLKAPEPNVEPVVPAATKTAKRDASSTQRTKRVTTPRRGDTYYSPKGYVVGGHNHRNRIRTGTRQPVTPSQQDNSNDLPNTSYFCWPYSLPHLGFDPSSQEDGSGSEVSEPESSNAVKRTEHETTGHVYDRAQGYVVGGEGHKNDIKDYGRMFLQQDNGPSGKISSSPS